MNTWTGAGMPAGTCLALFLFSCGSSVDSASDGGPKDSASDRVPNDAQECARELVAHLPTRCLKGHTGPLDDTTAWLFADDTDLYIVATFRCDVLVDYDNVTDILRVPIAGGPPTTLLYGEYQYTENHRDWVVVQSVYGADGYIYWIDAHNSVMRLSTTGGMPERLALRDYVPRLLAIGSNDVYWSEIDPSTEVERLMRLPLRGGTPATLTTLPATETLLSIAGGDDALYWTSCTTCTATPQGVQLVRTADNGTSSPLFTTSTDDLFVVFGASSTRAFFFSTAGIYTVPVAGGRPDLILPEPDNSPWLYVDDKAVYATPCGSDCPSDAGQPIVKVPVAGGRPSTVVSQVETNDQVTITTNDRFLFWAAGNDVYKICK